MLVTRQIWIGSAELSGLIGRMDAGAADAESDGPTLLFLLKAFHCIELVER